MRHNCTGVILAGGENLRLPGVKKAFRKVGGEMIFDTIFTLFSSVFDEVIIISNTPGDFAGWNAMLARDIFKSRCALAGLHTGLFHASNPYIFATACDTPFVDSKVIRHILDQDRKGYEVIIPRTEEGLEPLLAIYSKDCLPLMEANLKKGELRIKKCFRKGKVKMIPAGDFKQIDPDMRFVFNVNTPGDLETARKMAESGKAGRKRPEDKQGAE